MSVKLKSSPTKRIIVCLDVKNGLVVKGVRFKNLRKIGKPWELAKEYEKQGADEVVFLDISASQEGRKALYNVVERTAQEVFIPLTVGGGVRTFADFRTMLRCGADKVSINTAAVKKPALITEASKAFGAQCVVVAIDSQLAGCDDVVYIKGGTEQTSLTSQRWARKVCALGAGEILLTSIDADGVQKGYDLRLTREIKETATVPVIASGGCGSPGHMLEVFREADADAALAASIFHDGIYTVVEVKKFLKRNNIFVR